MPEGIAEVVLGVSEILACFGINLCRALADIILDFGFLNADNLKLELLEGSLPRELDLLFAKVEALASV